MEYKGVWREELERKELEKKEGGEKKLMRNKTKTKKRKATWSEIKPNIENGEILSE